MNIDEYVQTSDALFHYTKTAIAIEQILHTKKIKLSLLKDTNDPREYKAKLFNAFYEEVIEQQHFYELLGKANSVIDRILRYECRVMCFCTNNKPTLILSNGCSIEDEHVCSKGWDKSRMWSQYGQNHYGICLVFSKEEIEKILNSQIDKYEANYIKYSQKDRFAWRAGTINGIRLEKEGIEEYSYKHVIENSHEFFFTKHIDYRDEAEFRVVVFDSDKKHEYINISSALKCVIVGDRTPIVYVPLINQMCAELNIESRRVLCDKGKSFLVLCKVNS